MSAAQPRRPGETRDAAAELRAAVHDLAGRAIGVTPDAAMLRHAAALVREAAEVMQGEVTASWWEGPVEAPGAPGLRHYRHRSLFQGELHPFSPQLSWQDQPGPAGEPGSSFRVVLPAIYMGPPHAVHGGFVAGLFDELLGAVQALSGSGGGYTGRLTVRYRSLTPIGEELVFRGWVATDHGRRITTNATCHVGDRLCAEAEGLFVRPSKPMGHS